MSCSPARALAISATLTYFALGLRVVSSLSSFPLAGLLVDSNGVDANETQGPRRTAAAVRTARTETRYMVEFNILYPLSMQ